MWLWSVPNKRAANLFFFNIFRTFDATTIQTFNVKFTQWSNYWLSRLKVRCRSKENVSNDRFLLNNRCFWCQEKIVSMRCINGTRAKYWRQSSTTTLFCTCYHILSSKGSTWHNDFITFFSNTYALESSECKQIQIWC